MTREKIPQNAPHPPTRGEAEDAAAKKPRAADKPVVPGGRKPDSAMCENRDRPGMIDKSEDC